MRLVVTARANSSLGRMGAQTLRRVDAAVRAAAHQIQRTAAERAPVDTGYLKSSIYAVTSRGSEYDKAQAKANAALAKARKGGRNVAGRHLFPRGKATMPPGQAEVRVGAEYGNAVETGGHGRTPRPYLAPACRVAQVPFRIAIANVMQGGGVRGD